MKATKKQIVEIIEAAAEKNLNINAVLAMLENCSPSIFKAIGAYGFISAFEKKQEILRASEEGGISFNLCKVEQSTEKAFLLSFTHPTSVKTVERWVAKSVIKNDVIPFWAIK